MVHRDLILTLAARHKLPAVYPTRFFVTDGGLISYAPDLIDQHRRSAGYVDRILRGEKPADMPVQAPTKYALAVNLKTAKALGLTVPASVLARAASSSCPPFIKRAAPAGRYAALPSSARKSLRTT